MSFESLLNNTQSYRPLFTKWTLSIYSTSTSIELGSTVSQFTDWKTFHNFQSKTFKEIIEHYFTVCVFWFLVSFAIRNCLVFNQAELFAGENIMLSHHFMCTYSLILGTEHWHGHRGHQNRTSTVFHLAHGGRKGKESDWEIERERERRRGENRKANDETVSL